MVTDPIPGSKSGRWTTVAPVVGALIVFIGLLLWFTSGVPRSHSLTLTGGSAEGLRHEIANSLSRFATPQGVLLDVTPTPGSRDALRRVNQGQLDLALTQGGLPNDSYANIRQVAVLHIEPVHLLVKPTDDEPDDLDHYTLAALADRWRDKADLTINVSTKGSGTNALANGILNFFGLQAGLDYQQTTLSYSELMDPERQASDLPDAVFTVSSIPSPVARYLITQHAFRPVELPVADAFRIDWSPKVQDPDLVRVDRQRIVEATIPAFTYQVSPAVPAVPIETIGTRLHLVAHVSTPDAAIERVLDSIYDSPLASASEPPLTLSLLQSSAEYELHSGAASYLQKKTPIITEHVVELTEQVLAILGSVFAGVLFMWQGMLFFRRRRRDRQFLHCIERVGQIEQRALEFESDPEMGVDDLLELQSELNQIKVDMITQFQRGHIDGADTLSSFLMHVNDANENLVRTILHERSPKPSAQAGVSKA